MVNNTKSSLLVDDFIEGSEDQYEQHDQSDDVIQDDHMQQVEEYYEEDPIKEFLSDVIHQQVQEARTSLGKTDSIAILTDALLYVDLIAQMKQENNEILYDILNLSSEHRTALADLLYERDTIYSTIEEAKESIKQEWLNEANSYADEQRQLAFDRYVQDHPDDTSERLAAFEIKEKQEIKAIQSKVFDTTIQSLIEILEQNIVNGHEIAASNALLKVILARKFIRKMDEQTEEINYSDNEGQNLFDNQSQDIDLDSIINEGYQDSIEEQEESFETNHDEEDEDDDFDITVTSEDYEKYSEDSDESEEYEDNSNELAFSNEMNDNDDNEDEDEDNDYEGDEINDDISDDENEINQDDVVDNDESDDYDDPVIPDDDELDDFDIFNESQSDETSDESKDDLIDNTDFDNDEFYDNQTQSDSDSKVLKPNEMKQLLNEKVSETNTKKRNKSNIFLIIVSCIVFISLAAVCAYFLSHLVFKTADNNKSSDAQNEKVVESSSKYGFAVGDVLNVSANGKEQIITIESFNEQGALAKSEGNEVFLLTNQQLQNYQMKHSSNENSDTKDEEDANSENLETESE